MLSFGPPWKLALMGAVSLVAGIALFFVDWQLGELAAFVAMLNPVECGEIQHGPFAGRASARA